MHYLTIVLVLLLACVRADALEVFACEPEWAALVTELAGDSASVTIATTAFQDPHRLQAKPSLISAVRRADFLVCSGADLEVAWLPLLLRRSGNARIQPGSAGYVLAAEHVRRLEVPARIDRGGGDIHPQGNPHIHLSPRNIERVAKVVAEGLGEVDPANRAVYRGRLEDFQLRWDRAIDNWEERAAPMAGLRLVSHHLSFSYLADWLDLDVVANLEPKPGIPSSAAHLASLLESLSVDPPAGIVLTPYNNKKPSDWLSNKLDIPAVTLPYTVGGAEGVDDLFTLFDATLTALEGLRQ